MPVSRLGWIAVALAAAVAAVNLRLKPEPRSPEADRLADGMREAQSWTGRYPQDFELRLLDGTAFKLSDAAGRKVVVLNFFATWCEPCRTEMPELSRLMERHLKDPVVLIGLDANEDEDLVREFAGKEKLLFPVGVDLDDLIARRFSVRGRPTTVVIGADGRVAFYETGPIANADVSLEPHIQAGIRTIAAGGGVGQAVFLAASKAPRAPPPDRAPPGPPRPVLGGPARDFALRALCPSCRKPLAECRCGLCEAMVARLQGLDLKGKSDEAILKDLFMGPK